MTQLSIKISSNSLSPQLAVQTALQVETKPFSPNLEVALKAANLCVVLTLIGTVGKGEQYLEVSPTTMWVTPDMIQELLIKSNVDWTIT